MIKKSANVIVRVGAYIVIGFFSLIIIISFGMPDFVSELGGNQQNAATVNGEPISRLDLARYINNVLGNYKIEGNDQIRKMIFDQYINQTVTHQFAVKIGIEVSDDSVKKEIKRAFSDNNGIFNDAYLKATIMQMNMTFDTFFSMVKRQIILSEYQNLVAMSAGVSPEEISFMQSVNNSIVKIKYAYLSNDDIKTAFSAEIAVTDAEVEKEMKENSSKLKDPDTDKVRIREELVQKKITKIKTDLEAKVNESANTSAPFEASAAVLKTVPQESAEFKIGDVIKNAADPNKALYSLSDSEIFRADLLAIKGGVSSRCINAIDGIYVFSPITTVIYTNNNPAEAPKEQVDSITQTKTAYVNEKVMEPFFDKAKIVRFTENN